LFEEGRASGRYFETMELKGRRALRAAGEERDSARSEVLARSGRGTLHYTRALRALDRDQVAAAREALGEACRELPELSSRPAITIERLGLLPAADGPEGRLRVIACAAAAWPDQESETAVHLRLRAAQRLADAPERPIGAAASDPPPRAARRPSSPEAESSASAGA